MKKILVVDDDPRMAALIAGVLEKDGHQVITVDSGLEAVRVLEGYTPDVMFVDLIMPHMTGDRLCRLVREMPKLYDVFLVIVSAVAVEAGMDNFSEYGADACILKGPGANLKKNIRELLQKLEKGDMGSLSRGIIGREDSPERSLSGGRAEQEPGRRDTESIEAAQRALGEVVVSMAPDLRASLNSIVALADALGANATGNLNPDQVQTARQVVSIGANLLQQINALLARWDVSS